MFTIEKLYQSLNVLLTSQERNLPNLPQPWRLMVAYSGGLDSHVLLHSLASLRDLCPIELRAVHVHHGLSVQADQWALHCQEICAHLHIPCIVQKVTVFSDNIGIEAAARSARYSAIEQILLPDECLVLAHTQDDQAETLLLQLLRGGGVKGLAAMPELKFLGSNLCVRPLLNFSRRALQHYARAEKLQWVEDESNTNLRFDRNYVRHQILPVIENRWPSAKKTLARTATHCAEAAEFIEILAREDAQHVAGEMPQTLSVAALKSISTARQKNVLRFWLRQLALPVPATVKLKQLLTDVLGAKEDANPYFHWPGVEIYRYQNNLYALPPLTQSDSALEITWDAQQPLVLPQGLGVLTPKIVLGQGFFLPQGATVQIRFRRGGERLQLKGRLGTHTLKKLFQEWRVPPWQRERIPLIYIQEKLVAVVGFAVAKDCAVSGDTLGILVEWSPSW